MVGVKEELLFIRPIQGGRDVIDDLSNISTQKIGCAHGLTFPDSGPKPERPFPS